MKSIYITIMSTTQEFTEDGNPIVYLYEPTFRVEPTSEEDRFYPSRAREIAEQLAAEEIGDQEFDDESAKIWSLNISDKVREKVAASITNSRFKIIVQTFIGQIADQGVRVASRCLWDPNFDNYAQCTYTNRSLFATVLVFALYTD